MNTSDPRFIALKKIEDELINFKESPLYEYRTKNNYHPVVGEGNHNAKIIFIGEAPGENEAIKAKPFCGASGRILDELLRSINLNRDDVYVSNIVKDRPPENRDPTPQEIELYAPFLDRQINTIQPAVVATLGRFSMKYIMDSFGLSAQGGPISKLHGKIFEAPTSWGTVKIIPLYHPAVALYGASKKVDLLNDFKVLEKYM